MVTTKTDAKFITVPIKDVKPGEAFTPIERMGAPVFVVKRKKWERKWRMATKSYRMTSKPLHALDDEGKDAIFATTDWAVVRREPKPHSIDPNKAVDTLLKKFARHS